ncbi:hypothetical protein PLESTM_000727700 [Pleodorina starrii]|nr:hypothetical protein PLESTM_000727700 [Pleodorina starrii]
MPHCNKYYLRGMLHLSWAGGGNNGMLVQQLPAGVSRAYDPHALRTAAQQQIPGGGGGGGQVPLGGGATPSRRNTFPGARCNNTLPLLLPSSTPERCYPNCNSSLAP